MFKRTDCHYLLKALDISSVIIQYMQRSRIFRNEKWLYDTFLFIHFSLVKIVESCDTSWKENSREHYWFFSMEVKTKHFWLIAGVFKCLTLLSSQNKSFIMFLKMKWLKKFQVNKYRNWILKFTPKKHAFNLL